jgi:Peptidase S46
MKSVTAILLCVLVTVTLPLSADEGMWLFNQFPKDTVNDKYKFQVTDQFLDDLRLASAQIGGGMGSFVSPNGLFLTNQHLIMGCLLQLNSAQHDYLKDGYYAASQSAEVQCPGLEADVPVKIENVTTQVRSAAKDNAAAAQALQLRNAAAAKLEKDCAAKSGGRCSVVKLYSGARYDLYQYKQYKDLRLVFVPEYQLAFFGAERDAITYLRYGLDIAFLRAYENGRPAATPHYLKWSADGVKDGDVVFSAGSPQTSQRLSTASQLSFYRDTELPLALTRLQQRVQAVTTFAAQSEANFKAAQATLVSLLTDFKVVAGKLIGLRDDKLSARKSAFENKIRRSVENSQKDPKLSAAAGKAWDDVTQAYQLDWMNSEKPYQILEESPAPGSTLFQIARQLVRPAAQRDPKTLESDAPISDALETLLLTSYLNELKDLGAKESPIKDILAGKTPEETAKAMVMGTKLKDLAERKRLGASPDAVQKSTDPMIKFALMLDPPALKLRKKHADVIESLETSASEKIAQYRLKLFGASEYPDATNTPRAEYGVVKGYIDRAGIPAPPLATFSGLYYRRNNDGPYQVPQRWVDVRPKLDEITALDFVSTCDIGGGDAGGPVVNRDGELIGVTFDGNVESLPDTYLYSDEQARAVHVATQGIVEALQKVYGATALLQELGARPSALSASAGQ